MLGNFYGGLGRAAMTFGAGKMPNNCQVFTDLAGFIREFCRNTTLHRFFSQAVGQML
jgi:hypothetical protein